MGDSNDINIYKAVRTIKRKGNSLYNALRSIYEDSIFVGEISQLWPGLPLLANLRCGLWYSDPSKFHSTCYFKSTDGHANNWSFNTSRLNLHVALLCGERGGCMIVDATRKGKRFPDSMSKTIPIWACVLNRAVKRYRRRKGSGLPELAGKLESGDDDWDSSMHLPLWVSENEKAAIEERVEKWREELEASGADIGSISWSLKKPLRPLWISQKSVIWLNEVPDHDSWNFTPVILVSASSQSGMPQRTTSCEFSWSYIPGAADDEESWARGLQPFLFWKHAHYLISSIPESCNQKVADIVESHRLFCSYREVQSPLPAHQSRSFVEIVAPPLNNSIFWLGSTNVALAPLQFANSPNVDCVLSCCDDFKLSCAFESRVFFHLPIVKSDKFSITKNLPAAVDFAKGHLSLGKTLLVCCDSGDDISVCICLAILSSLFDDEGAYDEGAFFMSTKITKQSMRRRLVYICKYATIARPSRRNVKQVYAFLTSSMRSSSAC